LSTDWFNKTEDTYFHLNNKSLTQRHQ